MQIWVDADACPKTIKEILFRAAVRAQITTILVANQPLYSPTSVFIKKVQVGSGFDKADQYIIEHVEAGDLVITADIPLADAVVSKQATALNPRGMLYTDKNIKQHLSIRNFGADLRSSGMITGGPSSLSKKEIQLFSNCLDQYIAKKKR